MIKNISNYADIIAVPFFALLTYYLYNLKNKTTIEYILLLFSILGLILDTVFSYFFLTQKDI